MAAWATDLACTNVLLTQHGTETNCGDAESQKSARCNGFLRRHVAAARPKPQTNNQTKGETLNPDIATGPHLRRDSVPKLMGGREG